MDKDKHYKPKVWKAANAYKSSYSAAIMSCCTTLYYYSTYTNKREYVLFFGIKVIG